MSVEDVTKWVVDNHLKIKFNDRYDDTIKAGKIIECNYKKGDEIIENTEITILTSKGPIKIGKFQNVQEFETWARKYDINYQINSQYDNNVPSGQIISMSVKENDIIKNNDAITVIISKGKSMTVPKLIGLTKDKALNECAKAGIICSTTTGGYNDTISKGSVMNQSISANTEVSEGTRVLLTLSSGPEIKVKVPNFYGLTWSSISSKCTNLGLNCNYVYSGYNSATKDTCISQSISFDNMVSSNTKLTMTLSKGPAKTANITLNASCFNMGSYNDAKSCLEQALSDYINDDYPFEMRAIANSEEGPGRKIAGCGIGISATITQGQTTTICIGK